MEKAEKEEKRFRWRRRRRRAKGGVRNEFKFHIISSLPLRLDPGRSKFLNVCTTPEKKGGLTGAIAENKKIPKIQKGENNGACQQISKDEKWKSDGRFESTRKLRSRGLQIDIKQLMKNENTENEETSTK